MKSISNSVLGLLRVGFETLDNIFTSLSPEKPSQEYNAEFVPPSKILSPYNYGFSLDGRAFLTIENSFRHALIFGKTGEGKSTVILAPSIYRMMKKSSLIINDPGGGLYKICSGAAAKAGIKVLQLNWAKPGLCGYNPLKRAKSLSDYKKLSKLFIVEVLGKSRDLFWNIAAEQFLTILIRLVQYQPERYRNFANVLLLLQTFSYAPSKIDVLVIATGDSLLNSDYKAFISYDTKLIMSIVATCSAALSIFNDPQVALCTSYDTICFEEFRNADKPVLLFINNSIPDMKYYSVLTSLFMQQFWGYLMSYIPSPKERACFFLLDECSSLQLSLEHTIANLRKYRSGILGIYQSSFQLKFLFSESEAKAIEENVFARLYLPGQDIEVASKLEHTLGKKEYIDNEKNTTRIKPLLTASEIRMSKNALLLCSNLGPMQVRLHPYYKQCGLNALASIPPYEQPETLPYDAVPLIQFE